MSTTIDTSTSQDLIDQIVQESGVVDRLHSGAMVAEIGAGDGAAIIAMAQAFPRSAFSGYDADADAVAAARRSAQESIAGGAGGRNVRFEVAGATAIPAYAYDLVTTFAALDDLGDPLAVARHVRRAIAEDGAWMIVAPQAPESIAGILEDAGFTHVRVVTQTPFDAVLEARP